MHAHSPYDEPQLPPPVHVTFVDWIPGFCTLLGMIVVNMIDKDRVRGDEGFGDSRAVWRARLFLFIGFALMAGGLAGSVVRCPVVFPVNHQVAEHVCLYCCRPSTCSNITSMRTRNNTSTTATPTSHRTLPSCCLRLYCGYPRA